MPERRVAVELTLETANYLAEANAVERQTAAVDREMHELDRSVDKVDRDMAQLSASAPLAARAIDDVGDEALGTAAELTLLDARIRTTEASVRRLGLEFVRTGDAAAGKNLNDERSMLRKLQRLRRELTPIAQEGSRAFDFFGVNFSSLASESRGFAIAGAVGLGAAMAPVLAGIISSAVVGAIGAGGVVGGAVLAARDHRVQQAWTELGTSLMVRLDDAGAHFVDPLIRAAQTFKDAFDAADIVGTLKMAAVLVDPLTAALGGFVRELGPGLRAGIIGAEPTIRMLARELPDLARSISVMLQGMRSVAPEAARAMGDFFDVLGQGVEDTGDLLAGLTEVYTLTRSLAQSFKELTGADLFGDIIPTFGLLGVLGKLTRESVVPTLEQIGPASLQAAGGVGKLAAESKSAADELDDLLSAAQKLIPTAFDLEDAQDQAADAVARLKDQIKEQTDAGVEGAGQLVGNTQAARDNREAVRDLVAMYGDLIVKTVKVGGDTAVLRQQLHDQLVQMGFNEAEIAQYVEKLDLIPVKHITQLMVENQQALEAITETDRELRRLQDRSIQLTAYQVYRAGERQHGGDVMAGVPYVINERGSETVTFPASGTVHPANLTPAGGNTYNNFTVQAWTDRFSYSQVVDELALHGVH